MIIKTALALSLISQSPIEQHCYKENLTKCEHALADTLVNCINHNTQLELNLQVCKEHNVLLTNALDTNPVEPASVQLLGMPAWGVVTAGVIVGILVGGITVAAIK